MKLSITRMSTAALLAVLASASFAQYKENPFSVRAGIFYPTSGDTRSTTKTFGFNVGVSYQLPNLNMGSYSDAKWSLDLDGNWIGSGGNKLEAYDLMLVGRWMNTTMSAGQHNLYYGLGVGLTRQHGETSTTTGSGSSTTTTNTSEDKTGIVGKVLLGTQLNKQTSLELGFRFAPSVAGINANGLSLQVGFKF